MKKDISLIKNNAGMQVKLQRLHLEFGKQQGLAFYEKDYKGKNYLLYKMELYHVITYLQDIEKNSIWMSLVINAYLRELLLSTKYYISYAEIIVKNKQKIESVIKKVKKNNDFEIWIDFFLELLLEGVRRTNKIIETIILINLDVNAIIFKEKAKNMLPDVMLFIEKYPVFDIRDIEKN